MFNFNECFKELTGNHPFDWQERLFHKFLADDIPDACDIPTGLGKTSVLSIWLIALGHQLGQDKERKMPLRLVYVVDRRVIVDQATDEAEKLLKRLTEAAQNTSDPLNGLAQSFRGASQKGSESLFALSTLRGQKADNREWCLDPSRPAIIISTVDMLGSRLLFSGYGKVGTNHRSLQAGLLGQDTFIVVDEAHLSPVFVSTLFDIKEAIHRTQSLRPFHVMLLSATLSQRENVLAINESKESQNQQAYLRLHAKKYIEWIEFDQTNTEPNNKKPPSSKKINEAFTACVLDKAIQYEVTTDGESARSIVIFVRTVALVNMIAEALCKRLEQIAIQGETDKTKIARIRETIEARVLKLTGEMRGDERNKLVESPKFKAFLPRPEFERKTSRPTHYLIATSCAEVGVNMDADHGICDLVSLDSMIQRIGRINRFGMSESTISVILDRLGLNAVSSDLEKDKEHAQLLLDLSTQQMELENQLQALKNTKPPTKTERDEQKQHKKHLEEQIKDIKKRKTKLEKSGTKYGLENVERINKQAYFTWQALKAKENESGRIDASPLALRGLLANHPKALPDIPVSPPFDSARIDDWAMTSLKHSDYPRPLVQYCLRGVMADKDVQTTLVWRVDLNDFYGSENLTESERVDLATTIPIQPQERANLATHRAETLLKSLANKFPDKKVVLLNAHGEAHCYSLQELKEEKELFSFIAFSTVIFPCEIGGMDSDGNPLDKVPQHPTHVSDVVNRAWTRYLITRHASGNFSIRPIEQNNSESSKNQPHVTWQTAVRSVSGQGICKNTREILEFFARENEQNTEKNYLAYFFNRKAETDREPSYKVDYLLGEDDDIASMDYPPELKPRTVAEHNDDVKTYVLELAKKIGLPTEITESLSEAGVRHDLGKNREWWQKAIGNQEFKTNPIAKSKQNSFDHAFNQGYRHEFGSLLESIADETLQSHSHRDLILHLIAAHHGYARPHFPERAFDRNQPKPINQQIAHDTMLRFIRLQQQYGWWQLAYLEAILKAADAMASHDFSRGAL